MAGNRVLHFIMESNVESPIDYIYNYIFLRFYDYFQFEKFLFLALALTLVQITHAVTFENILSWHKRKDTTLDRMRWIK